MPVVEGVKGAEKVADNTPDRKNTPNTSKTDKTEGGENQKPANESGNDKKTTNEKDKTEGENTSKEKNPSDETEGRKVTREDNGQKTGSGVETSGEEKEIKIEKIDNIDKSENPTKRKTTTSENSKKLAENLKKEGRTVGEGEAAAHIVASTGSKRQWEAAADSRKLLSKYNIDINDAANGIPLGHPRPHNLTHNKGFHEMVNSRLYLVENNMLRKGYGKKAIRSALRKTLRNIGKEFENEIKHR